MKSIVFCDSQFVKWWMKSQTAFLRWYIVYLALFCLDSFFYSFASRIFTSGHSFLVAEFCIYLNEGSLGKLIYLDEVVEKRYKIVIHTNKYQSKTSKKDKE